MRTTTVLFHSTVVVVYCSRTCGDCLSESVMLFICDSVSCIVQKKWFQMTRKIWLKTFAFKKEIIELIQECDSCNQNDVGSVKTAQFLVSENESSNFLFRSMLWDRFITHIFNRIHSDFFFLFFFSLFQEFTNLLTIIGSFSHNQFQGEFNFVHRWNKQSHSKNNFFKLKKKKRTNKFRRSNTAVEIGLPIHWSDKKFQPSTNSKWSHWIRLELWYSFHFIEKKNK